MRKDALLYGLILYCGWGMTVAAAEEGPYPLKAVTLYASFDDAVIADHTGGEKTLSTRFNHETEKGKFVFEKGFDDKVFRIAPGKGIAGGALQPNDVLPRNGRIFFPAKGNIAFKKGGWGGAMSMWINTDPNKLLKLKFCDPIQMTEKGANNGGIWFDFNDAQPRDMRMGVFPFVPEGTTGIKEEDPNAPMVRVKAVDFKVGDWHHMVINWRNFDTGKKDAGAGFYIDGKLIGEVKDREITMNWDLEKAGIYIAVNYIGLLDEFALFDRPLTAEEITALHIKPDLLQALKQKKSDKEESRLPLGDWEKRTLAAGENDPTTNRLRQEMLKALTTPEGDAQAEKVLQLLLRLPSAGKLPEAPKFPFEKTQAMQYRRDFAVAKGLPEEWSNRLGMRFVLIPPGTYLMGSPEDEPGRGEGFDETQHTVTLSQPFYLGKFEVTNGCFGRFVAAGQYTTDGEKNGGGNAHDEKAVWKHRPGTHWKNPGYAGPFERKDEHPVVHISHNDARAFCAWLQETSGVPSASVRYDLPTEAQWEWACRAGRATIYSWGTLEDLTEKSANVGDLTLKQVHPDWPREVVRVRDGHAFAAPVGSFAPNAFGVHDMLGNVWEFCSTRSGPYPKGSVVDPGDCDPKRGFAVRGGGWSNVAKDYRCAVRNADPPNFCHSNLGFRVAVMVQTGK